MDSIINEINSTKKNSLRTQTSAPLDEKVFPGKCPYCESNFPIMVENLPLLNENIELNCPECDMGISVKIPNSFYLCDGCNKNFETILEKANHVKTCKKYIERTFTCNSYNTKFTFDNDEVKELEIKRKIEVSCPKCNKINKLVKWNNLKSFLSETPTNIHLKIKSIIFFSLFIIF